MKKKKPEPPANKAVLDLIAPQGLAFYPNKIAFSGLEGQGYAVLKYPSSLPIGWLSDIMSLESTIVSVLVSPVDELSFINALDKSINAKSSELSDNMKTSRRQRTIKAIEDAEELMRQLDQDGKAVCELGISYIVMSDDEKTLKRLVRRAMSICAGKGIRTVRLLSRRQDLLFRQCIPTCTVEETVSASINRVAPISTFVGGFPFSSPGFSDSAGNYFGRSENNSAIMLDLWIRGGDRTNTNILVSGIQGLGKSTVVKSIAITEYKDGTRLIFIDPEGEYSELAENLGGDVLFAGGGNARINPFEVQTVPEDDDEESSPIYKTGDEDLGALALHLKTLEIFLNTYIPELTMIQNALLKQAIIEMYADFNILWATDVTKLAPEDFPTFSDLYRKIENKYKETSDEDYRKLNTLLYDAVFGADQFLWNGKTTIDTNNQCVVLNTAKLVNNSENVQRAQYFLLLTWCWSQMSKDRQEKVLLFCDEAYMLVDPKIPQALGFLRNAVKRDRKYESGIVIITHSENDLLDPAVKMYGQALIDIPCYKILFGTDGQNLI